MKQVYTNNFSSWITELNSNTRSLRGLGSEIPSLRVQLCYVRSGIHEKVDKRHGDILYHELIKLIEQYRVNFLNAASCEVAYVFSLWMTKSLKSIKRKQ